MKSNYLYPHNTTYTPYHVKLNDKFWLQKYDFVLECLGYNSNISHNGL